MVAPGAVLRADEGAPFYVCKGVNIQDNVVLHGLFNQFVDVNGKKYSIYIDSHCSISHCVIIHGPSYVGKKSFIGFRSTIHNSQIGRNCFVGTHCVIQDSTVAEFCHVGIDAKILGVVVERERCIPDGMLVNTQSIADSLPKISKEQADKDKLFNTHVVDINKKKLRKLYSERRRLREEVISLEMA
ncbi:hypothetical protein HGB13_03495 [bacterium]|nr:hypothetical protein [bacterium]